jgi:hypothetical protein
MRINCPRLRGLAPTIGQSGVTYGSSAESILLVGSAAVAIIAPQTTYAESLVDLLFGWMSCIRGFGD